MPNPPGSDATLAHILVDNAPVALYFVDAAGDIVYVNAEYRRMFDLSATQSPDDWALNVHPEDRRHIEALWADFRSAPRPMKFEYRTLPRNGTARHLAEHVVAAPGANGFVGTISDFTDLAVARHTLRQATRLYQDTFDQAPVGIAYSDRDGRLLKVNAACCALLGFDAAALVGKTVHELTHVDDRATTARQLDRLWGGVLDWVDMEKRCVRADGRVQWVRVTCALVREGDSTPTCAVEFLRDITERKRAEDQLRAVTERFTLAALTAGIGVWELLLPSNTVRWDEQMYRLYGRERGAADEPYALWASLLHPADRDAVEREFAEALSATSTFDTEFRILRPDGAIRHIKAAAQVRRDPSGVPISVIGVNFDITTRKLAEQALVSSEQTFRSLFELSPVGIALNELQSGRFLHLNDALAAPTGYTRDELLQMTYWDITPTQYAADEDAQLEALTQSDQYGPYEKEYRRKDGSTYPVMLSGVRLKDAQGRDLIWSMVQDISLRKAMESQLADAACRDKLTGLANRAMFMDRLNQALERVNRAEQRCLAVLFLDFDRFKLVNDTLGHEAGDELLRQIGDRLRREVRTADALTTAGSGNVTSRFGGDEFLLLLNDLQVPEDATRVAERLLNALAPAYEILGSEVHSSASIGIVTSAQCRTTAEDIVRNADVAMYEAKRAGRACSVVFDEAMHTRLARHMTIENNLRRAIGASELYLVYQPIVELASGQMVSVEALLRWNHPSLGAIEPDEFIPIAEESNLIIALGQWVQREACRTMAQWRRADPQRAPQTMSVNVSRAELAMGRRLITQISDTLTVTGLPAECLQLEVTEREVMREPEAAQALLCEFARLGVKLAMDDFGTGTSSLSLLRNYPFDVVKIDRSFVNDVTTNSDVLAVIHATVLLIENLGMASLAEGVEDPGQVAILQSLGCRYAQGFFFCRPVRAEKVLGAVRASIPAPSDPTIA